MDGPRSRLWSRLYWGGGREALASCEKWVAALDQCDILPSTCQFSNGVCQSGTCTPLAQLTFAQRRAYYQVLYSDTPKDACDKWKAKRHPTVGGTATFAVSAGNPAFATCGISGTGTSYGSTTTREPIVRESCCEENVVGPHASVVSDVWYAWYSNEPTPRAMAPEDGMEFSDGFGVINGVSYKAHRVRVKERNQLRGMPPFNVLLPAWMSDLYKPGKEALRSLEPAECGGILSGDANGPCAPQVDHIIPRKDVFGCDCGPNSYRNALLISRSLNSEMSDNCAHPKRQAILNFFRVPPVASLPARAQLIVALRPDLGEIQSLRAM